MLPSSLGGGRTLRRTLSVCLSVRPVIVAIGNVFSSTASVMDVGTYFSARTEGRISYGHLGRTCRFLYYVSSFYIIEYTASIWDHYLAKDCDLLETLQRRSVRFVEGHYRTSIVYPRCCMILAGVPLKTAAGRDLRLALLYNLI